MTQEDTPKSGSAAPSDNGVATPAVSIRQLLDTPLPGEGSDGITMRHIIEESVKVNKDGKHIDFPSAPAIVEQAAKELEREEGYPKMTAAQKMRRVAELAAATVEYNIGIAVAKESKGDPFSYHSSRAGQYTAGWKKS